MNWLFCTPLLSSFTVNTWPFVLTTQLLGIHMWTVSVVNYSKDCTSSVVSVFTLRKNKCYHFTESSWRVLRFGNSLDVAGLKPETNFPYGQLYLPLPWPTWHAFQCRRSRCVSAGSSESESGRPPDLMFGDQLIVEQCLWRSTFHGEFSPGQLRRQCLWEQS